MSDIRQRVVVNGVASGWDRVESGVPPTGVSFGVHYFY